MVLRASSQMGVPTVGEITATEISALAVTRLTPTYPSYSYVPVAVVTTGVLAGKSATTISSGMNHTCVLASGQPFCWGNDYSGELGDGSLNPSFVPVAVVTDGALSGRTITQIVASYDPSFALTAGAPNTPMAAGAFT